jgi:hypothetical protein
MFQTAVLKKNKTRILRSVNFLNRAVYEKMRKNIVEPLHAK